jgi:hypothetical protein
MPLSPLALLVLNTIPCLNAQVRAHSSQVMVHLTVDREPRSKLGVSP